MNFDDLKLSDLAISSTVYNLTPYNVFLGDLKEATKDGIDLNDPAHRGHLLIWLNKWGCRLAIEHLETTSTAIEEWYKQTGNKLFPKTKTIWELNDQDISDAANIYGSLKDKIAAQIGRGSKVLDRHIGPTAASKILFALRPEALMPWDGAMRQDFDDASSESYRRFLQEIRNMAWRIRDLCKENGFDIRSLPSQIERPDSTVLEIINEYVWVTVTNKCKPPSSTSLKRWASWK